MTSLKEQLRLHREKNQQIITTPYREWLVQLGERGYPEELADWVAHQLKLTGRVREGSFSASSGGICLRRQELAYLGAESEEVSISPILQNLFNDGKWRHLRWQIALMTMGIMKQAEVSLVWPKMRLKGSADGLLVVPDDHPNPKWQGRECGFELKGMNPFTWQAVKDDVSELEEAGKNRNDAIKPEHWAQVSRYALVSGWELFSVVYENKATQDWLEFVIEVDDKMLTDAEIELAILNDSIENENLTPMLPECVKGQGEYKFCPFGQNRDAACPKSGTWPKDWMLEEWRN